MTVSLVELLVGLYLVGISISLTRSGQTYARGLDLFKLILGLVLIILFLVHGGSLV